MTGITLDARTRARRRRYGVLAGFLLVSVVFEAAKHATGYWQIAVFATAPDLTLLAGLGSDLARGQLHPRAVVPYNVVHSMWSPLALLLIACLPGMPLGYFIGGLAWSLHIAIDRALGYGLRTRDGFQRN